MRVVFHCPWGNARNWLQILREAGPEISFETAETIEDANAIRGAVVWSPPKGFFDAYPKLEVIAVLGAGADYLFVPGMRLPAVPIARIVDPLMAERIAGWVLATTLHFHRQLDLYQAQQCDRRWLRHEHPDFADVRVGVMGLGTMGSATARLLARVGYDVAGWSRSAKTVEGIRSFSGEEELIPFLNRSDFLVCLLPLTAETRGILGAATFAALPKGAVILNAGRGAHLIEADLFAALEEGRLRAAALDVFGEEPLPEDHPLWTHPKILVTPHVASLTNPRTGAEQIVAALRTVRAGGVPENMIDPERGY
jgi:glyoxylate/hydroxypyruvate reductase A